ncbi:uncharacterized protein LOC119987530 [Tripterygium wilfordii]|uniref:uncharacterized protein LOC119987530 n=1 Tax=Tripterygium wilfordii TaxID=458696 RepID=UPI0018F84A3B|nr:uncharacterized protein LOC119987530 [Tripterygium wilfordii]
MDNLQRRGISLVNRCCLCKAGLESISHLLLHCEWSSKIWANILRLLGISWVTNSSVDKELLAWKGVSRDKRLGSFIQLIPISVMWMLWLERNNRVFKSKDSSIDTFLVTWFDCLRFWGTSFSGNIFDHLFISPL